jgi:hypothetical protein
VSEQPAGFKNCVRCNIRCRVAAERNREADLFVHGTARTGLFCANCLVVDFFKNCDIGPSSSLGKHHFDRSLPQPEYEKDRGQPDRRFDPECLRLPHVQTQFRAILAAAQVEYGAELTPGEIDWDEVVANWDLPFPEKPRRAKRRKGGKR